METANGIAKDAAGALLGHDPVLGAVCIFLGLALLGVSYFGWRILSEKDKAIAALNTELVTSERGFRKELSMVEAKVETKLDQVGQLIAFLTAKGK